MRTPRHALLGASLLALVCCREHHDQPVPIASAALASLPLRIVVPTAQPVAPPSRPLELGEALDLPVRDGQRSPGTSIEVRVLPERRPGEQLDTSHLRHRVPLTRSLRGALSGTPGNVKWVPHEATDVSGLGAAPFVVVGAKTGLWLHERRSLARRARLVGVGIRALSANPDGSLLAYATDKGDVEIIGWPSLRAVARRALWASRLHWSSDGRWLGIATSSDDAALFDAKAQRFLVVNTQDDTHDVAPLPGDAGLAVVANDSDAMQLFDVPRRKKLAEGRSTGRDLIAAAYDPGRREIIVGGDANSIEWYDEKDLSTPRRSRTFDADIYGLVCCRQGHLVVAFDERALALLSPSGETRALVGPLDGWSGTYSGRAALLDDDRVMAVLGGEAFVWEPGVSMTQAIEYGRRYEGPSDDHVLSVTADDIVALAVRDPGTTIVRVRKGAPALDVEAEAIGSTDVFAAHVSVTAAPDGARVVQVLDSHSSPPRSELALLSRGGALSEWMKAPAACGKAVKKLWRGRDEAHWVMMMWDGSSCEIAREPLGVQPLDLTVNPKRGSIRWDGKKQRYVVQ